VQNHLVNLLYRNEKVRLLLAAFLGVLVCTGMAGRRPAERTDGKVYATQFAQTYGFAKPTIHQGKVILNRPTQTLILTPGSRKAELDGRIVWLNAAVTQEGRHILIEGVDAASTLRPLLVTPPELARRECRVIMIDAGHGGADDGCVSPYCTSEKHHTLHTSQFLRDRLVQQGYTVHMTRSTDVFVSLEDRARLARHIKADLFISVHYNGSSSSSAVGVETFALSMAGYPSTHDESQRESHKATHAGNAFNTLNIYFADLFHQQIVAASKRPDRGLKRARFVVLRDAPCPAALVELGFLTHPQESKIVTTPAYQQKMAEAIAKAVNQYAADIRRLRLLAPDKPVTAQTPAAPSTTRHLVPEPRAVAPLSGASMAFDRPLSIREPAPPPAPAWVDRGVNIPETALLPTPLESPPPQANTTPTTLPPVVVPPMHFPDIQQSLMESNSPLAIPPPGKPQRR